MCGIVGYIGYRKAVPVLVEGLKKLEYRGYDSAGIAVLENNVLEVTKSVGKIKELEEKLVDTWHNTTIGIGHTRWATHGRPSDVNSHPHTDCTGKFAVVHNGIIENYMQLREWLISEGHNFVSETDTEVLPHLVEHFYKGDLRRAVEEVMSKVHGSYAMVTISQDNPDILVAARKDNPLVIGKGENENFFASDIPAILAYTRNILTLEDGEVAVVSKDTVEIFRHGHKIDKQVTVIKWDAQAAEKGGFKHFMIKEIHEQPKAIKDTLRGRISSDGRNVVLDEVKITAEDLKAYRKIVIIACGTAYHAGVVAKYALESLVRIPVEVDIASEFRYRDPIIDSSVLAIVVSQSGETADTLAALREAKRHGCRVIAITNVLDSSIAREANDVVYTWAGPEIAVASTKAYVTQLVALYLFTFYLASIKGTMPQDDIAALLAEMQAMPKLAQDVITRESKIHNVAKTLAKWEDTFFIGRGLDYAVALEGSLKLKEISYIHAEAYAAGELKHGTLALIVPEVPVIALVTQENLYEKTVSNIKEIKARDAWVVGFAMEGKTEIEQVVDETIYLPRVNQILAPILTVIPLQLLSYYAAVERGCDVDQPRNLAKSVTVE